MTSPAECETSGSFTIGHLTDLSGPTSANFRPLFEGMQAYVDYVNSQCGVHGKLIELVSADDRAEPVRGIEEFKRLISDPDVIAVTGLSISPVILALLPEVDRAEVPVLVGGSNVAEANDPVRPYVFTTSPVLTESLPLAASYLKSEEINQATIDLCAIDSPGGQAVLDFGASVLEDAGYSIGQRLALPTAGTEFSAEVLRLRNSDGEFLTCVISEQQTIPLLEAIQANGVDRKIIMAQSSASDQVLERFSGLDYIAYRTYVSPAEEEYEAVTEMVEQAASVGAGDELLQQLFFTQGWVLGKVIVNAIDACGADCSRPELRDALEELDYDCEGQQLCGGISFSPEDHYGFGGARYYVWSAEDGRGVAVSDEWLVPEAAG